MLRGQVKQELNFIEKLEIWQTLQNRADKWFPIFKVHSLDLD